MEAEHKTKRVRILTMSDTHDLHFRVDVMNLPPADIFIHSGDFTKFSGKAELKRFREFLNLLPYKHKIVVAGNHDFGLDRRSYQGHLKKTKHQNMGADAVNTQEEIQQLKKVCTYLEHESIEVEGVKIFGSPYSLEFHDWGFMYSKAEAFKLWSCIPQGTDVVVTHGPPFGIQDQNYTKYNCGCQDLLNKVMQIKPKLHVFGHIHEAYGTTQKDGIIFHNASNTNLAYKFVNKAQIFEIEVKA